MSQTDSKASRIETAAAFLHLLVRGAPQTGVLALTARVRSEGEGERDRFTSAFFTVEEIAAAAKWAINFCDRKETDVYVRCSLLREKPSKGRGRKEDTLGASVLWVDLDGDQEAILARLRDYPRPPSHVHNSGHGVHAFWLLERFEADSGKVESANRGLIRDLGGDLADHAWDITRVLRIPGTRNYKGDEALPVVPLEATNAAREYPILVFPLLATPERIISTESLVPEPLPTDFLVRLPLPLRALIVEGKGGATKPSGEPDRSANDWAIVRALLDLRYPVSVCLSVLCHSKWASGEKRLERGEISNALLTIARATEGRIEYQQAVEEQREVPQRWTFAEFMAANFVPPRWQVENIWLDRNIGFLAGEPKTFKTWLALDLALSIASGRPFLGHFPVLRSGPTLLIQREDPPGYLQDRVEKIAIAKGLGGSVLATENEKRFRLRLPTPPYPPLFVYTEPDFQLPAADSLERLNDWLEAEGCSGLAAIILDPLLKLAMGFDEYKASDIIANVFQPVDSLRRRWGASVVIVHHEHKGGKEKSGRGGQRMYGSMGLHAFAESALYLTRLGPEQIDVTSEYKSEAAAPFSVRFPNLREEYRPELGVVKLNILSLIEHLSTLERPASTAELVEHFRLDENEVTKALTKAIQRGAIVSIPGARRKGEPNRFQVVEESKEAKE